ncbi:MAG TPA: YihY/virulence factor BrkB family protein [Thermoleophilaceae bacterium]
MAETTSWRSTLRRTIAAYRDDDLGDWAASLTYYGILSIFPALLTLVSVLGLIGPSITQPLIHNLESLAPGPANEIVTNALRNIEKSQGAAGVLFVLSLAAALWTASGYVGGFMRASNAVYGVEEGRPLWKTLPTRLALTVVLLLLVGAIAVAVTFTGPLAKQAGGVLGIGSEALAAWSIAKWPVVLLGVLTIFAVLYWAAPNVKQPGFRWVSAGSVAGLLLWIAASAAFAVYVANFASYNKTYGALAGVVVFLVWLWLSNVAILLGAELNAERERSRAGRTAREPSFELREVPS